jgi:hypothetical protein
MIVNPYPRAGNRAFPVDCFRASVAIFQPSRPGRAPHPAARPGPGHERLDIDMRRALLRWALTCIAGALCVQPAQAIPTPAAGTAVPDTADAEPAASLAWAVIRARDHHGMPFAIVDKHAALLLVYRGDGSLAGRTPILIGRTPGDRSMPGVGERAQRHALRGDDRTTPAGRFDAEPGHNLNGEAIVWVDYASALAIHRLRPGPLHATRAPALDARSSPRDRRLSDGCIVVPTAFYAAVVQAVLGRGHAVVYVMPEDGRWQQLWPDLSGA